MVLKDRDPPKPLYFPVVLTAEDGTQLYGASLTFYEQLSAAEVQDLYNTFYTGEGSSPRVSCRVVSLVVSRVSCCVAPD